MARRKAIGRPKTRGIWAFHVRCGNPQNMTHHVDVAAADARKRVHRFFTGDEISSSVRRFCTKEEQERYASLLVDIDQLPGDDSRRWDAGPLVFEFTCGWGSLGRVTMRAEITRAKSSEEVKAAHGLL